jgi:hypothetical protein
MNFFSIFLLILLGGYLIVRLSLRLFARKLYKMSQRAREQDQPGDPGTMPGKKKISQNTGEYIDYEEIAD